MATGGIKTIDTTWNDLLHVPGLSGDAPTALYPGTPVSTDRSASQFMVGVPASAANPAMFRVEGMHTSDEGLVLAPGMVERFWAADKNISIVRAKGVGGSTQVVFGILATNTNVG